MRRSPSMGEKKRAAVLGELTDTALLAAEDNHQVLEGVLDPVIELFRPNIEEPCRQIRQEGFESQALLDSLAVRILEPPSHAVSVSLRRIVGTVAEILADTRST